MNKNNEKKVNNNWWKWFWATIIILMIAYIGLNITASQKLNEMPKKQRQAKLETIFKKFKQKFPEFVKLQQNLTKEAIENIKEVINKKIDAAYEPVYNQIDNFTDFHFSITGEYTELFTLVFGDVSNILQKHIFKPANFNKNLNEAFNDINKQTLSIIKNQLDKMKDKVKDKMDLNDDEVNYLFTNILQLTKVELTNRFNNIKNYMFKGFGLGSGAFAGAIIAKMVSKNIAKVIAKKIATKLAIKAGTKVAAAGAGAAAGAESGFLCGPGAWLCSPIGAVVGGIVGWFASDKIIVEVDKYYNANDFKKDLKNLINQAKNQTKQTLYKVYTNSLIQLSNQNIKSIEKIKSEPIKNLIIK